AIIGVIGTYVVYDLDERTPPGLLKVLRRYTIFSLAVVVIGTFAIATLWLWMPLNGTDFQKELLRGYLTSAILTATYAALYWRESAQEARRLSYPVWVIAGAVVALLTLLVAIHYLDRFPRLNTIDELQNWIVQWTVANTGMLGSAIYRQMLPMPVVFYDGPHLLLGQLLKLFGDSFWQARVARLLLACLALPFIYLSGKRMYGQRAGLLAVVFALIIIIPTNFVRPDFFLGLMLSIDIYLYLRARTTRRPWLHFLTGLVLAFGIEGHPLVYRFGIALALIYLARWCSEMVQTRRFFLDGRFFALGLGALTAILIWFSLHILPDFQQGWHFIANYMPGGHASSYISNPLTQLLGFQLEVWAATSPFEVVIISLGVALAIWQHNDGDRLLLTLLFVSEFLLIATHYYFYRDFYQIHSLPIFALLGGRFLADLSDLRGARESSGRLAGLVMACMILCVSLAVMVQNAQAANDDPIRDDFTAIGRQLKTDLPKDAVVVGNEDYFLEIRSMNYYGIQTVTTPNWFLMKYQGDALWEVTKPDMIILSGDTLDIPKYTDTASLSAYMSENAFQLVRCYHSGSLVADVYAKQIPAGWTSNEGCQGLEDGVPPWLEK
ncbi:MAG TPA: glycosyltransferase family 39 protein, partial [Aggregatilineales bacterium]|nr:glycosyltransferase family 39 protein [Aggregatilineales bacterium]